MHSPFSRSQARNGGKASARARKAAANLSARKLTTQEKFNELYVHYLVEYQFSEEDSIALSLECAFSYAEIVVNG